MKKQNLFALIGLPVIALFVSCDPSRYDIGKAAQVNQVIFKPFIFFDINADKLTTFLDDFIGANAIGKKDRVEVSLESISDDLVTDGRQLSIESSTVNVLESANESCLLTARYPEFSGMRNESLQAEINQSLKQEIEDLMGYFPAFFSEDEGCTAPTDLDRIHLEIDPCVVMFVKDDVISMRCNSFLAGRQVYPIVQNKGINLNLRTGEFYHFDDLFDEEYDYEKRLKSLLFEQNRLNDFEMDLIPTIKEDTVFYIRANCPMPTMDSICLAIPTNGTSGADRGRILYMNVEPIRDALSSEKIVQALLN